MPYTLLAVLLLAGWGCLAPASAHGAGELPPGVLRLLQRHRIPASSLGVFVQDVSATQPLIDFNSGVARNPASTIKLLTTFAALDMLGPAYTWQTEVYATGPVSHERLDGDLVIKGYGDPFLVTESYWKLARQVRERGIREIAGDVVADRSYFEISATDRAQFDGRPFRAYNATPDALLVNFQTIRFGFAPDRTAGKVRISADPDPENLRIENDLRLTGGRCGGATYRVRMDLLAGGESPAVRFSGTYPAACGRYQVTRVVADPAPLALGVFASLWRELGGDIGGRLRTGTAPQGAEPLVTQDSPPLGEIIRSINKYSNNVMARQVLLTLGAERFGPPGTVAKGRQAITEWLADNGLDFPGLVLDNGAGLSRDTRVSARSLGRLLLFAWHHPWMPEFVSSLSIAAMDGTLRRRFRGDALAGMMHIKTGQIDDVKAIAGYLQTRSGRTLVVVSLQNYPGIQWGRGQELQQALLRWLYEQ